MGAQSISQVDLSNWNVLSSCDHKLLQKIKLIKFFGEEGESALMVTDEDEAFGVGANSHGKLGIGSRMDSKKPTLIPQLCGKRITQFDCGEMHSVCVTTGGQVYCWGDNSQGQLGLWKVTESVSPVALPYLTTVVTIACGYSFTIALTRNNQVYAWGRNDVYQCGTNSGAGVVVPSRVELPEGLQVAALAAGWGFSLALTSSGRVYCWGGNSFGQLGDSGESRWRPSLLHRVEGAVMLGAGARHGLALTRSGDLWAWGSDPNPDKPSAPRVVLGLPPVTSIAAVWRYNVLVAESDRAIHMSGSFTADGWKRVSYVVPMDIGCPEGSGRPRVAGLFANREAPFMGNKDTLLPFDKSPIMDTEGLFNKEELSDITLEVGNMKIFCHKLILKLSCPHFKKILSEPWLNYHDKVLFVKDYTPHVYFDFIKYIYTKKLVFEDPLDLIEMWHIGVCYQHDGLRSDVVENCKKALSVDNMAEFYQQAVKQRSSELEEVCLQQILQNFKEVTKSSGYKNLDGDTAKELTVKWSDFFF